ncbi:MAG: zinc ribbon domain-containing protein [Elusimicrobiota bacterium]
MNCPKCNYENKDDALYCGLCYEVLKREVSPEKDNATFRQSKKSYIWVIWLFFIIMTAGYLLLTQWASIIETITKTRIQKNIARREKELIRELEKRRQEFNPYTGEANINVNPVTVLNSFTRDEFINFRKNRVAEYSFLNIFPKDYSPHDSIFGSITFGVDWVEGIPFYVCNPYLLIILTCADHATPIAYYCKNTTNIKVNYSNGKIEEIYEGEEALNWFNILYSYDDNPGIIAIRMVNARDAHLLYACIDKEKTVNVDFSWSASPNNITNSIRNTYGFFHVGKYGKNNFSPEDNCSWLKLSARNKYTCIYIKLYLMKLVDINQKEDFAYIIKIIP